MRFLTIVGIVIVVFLCLPLAGFFWMLPGRQTDFTNLLIALLIIVLVIGVIGILFLVYRLTPNNSGQKTQSQSRPRSYLPVRPVQVLYPPQQMLPDSQSTSVPKQLQPPVAEQDDFLGTNS